MLALDDDPLIASALWFQNNGAIDTDDIILLRGFRSHRNEIVHELPKFIGDIQSNVQQEYFYGMLGLVAKIDQWWIKNFEIAINPDFDARNLSEEDLNGVQSMSMIMMNLLISVADGKDDQLRWLYTEMKKNIEAQKPSKSD